MNIAHLSYLQCPTCHSALSHMSGNAETGWVVCESQHRFAIQYGVLDLLGPARPQSLAAQSNEWPITAWVYERLWRPYALSILSGQSFPLARELDYICGDIRQPRVIVDIACSNGLYARAMQTTYPDAHVIGIDRAWPMLIEAHQRAQRAQLSISYVRADARALPIHAQVADVIAVGGSWNEMEHIETVMSELQRISRPFASLRSMGLTAATSGIGHHIQHLAQTGGVHFDTPDAFVTLLAAYGWHVTNQQLYGVVQLIKAQQRG